MEWPIQAWLEDGNDERKAQKILFPLPIRSDESLKEAGATHVSRPDYVTTKWHRSQTPPLDLSCTWSMRVSRKDEERLKCIGLECAGRKGAGSDRRQRQNPSRSKWAIASWTTQ